MASYCATKAAISNWGQSMHYELESNIDVTVWEPGYVRSNIHVEGDPPPAIFTLDTDKAVSDALACLGKTRKTRASLRYEFSPVFPPWFWGPLGANGIRKIFHD